MTLAEIEESVLQALDDGHEPTVEAYAEHAASCIDMGGLTEALCLAIINVDSRAWSRVIALTDQWDAGLADALNAIERHIDRQRAVFIERRARRLSDEAEHHAQLLAELNAELSRGTYP